MDIDTLANYFNTSAIMYLVAWFALFNLVITVLEAIIDYGIRKQRRWSDSAANTLLLVANSLLERTWYGAVFFVALLPFYYFMSPVEWAMTPGTWIVAILLADLSYYWMHRTEHKYRCLWALHSVHHSSEDFNLSVAFRLSVFEGAIEWIFLVPMVVLGFNPFQVIVAFILIAQYQAWIHTEHISKLSWLEGWLNTPSSHRVHHGSNTRYLDCNYGGVLMIWDRLFGTYRCEDERVVYGLTKNINSNNPLKITFSEINEIYRNVKRCEGVKEKFAVLFGRLT